MMARKELKELISCPRRRHASRSAWNSSLRPLIASRLRRCESLSVAWPRRSDPRKDRSDEAPLVRAAKARLTPAADRRLKTLIARSERGRLTREELAEYQALAQEVQQLDAARVEALAKLARSRGKSLRVREGGNRPRRRRGWHVSRSLGR